MCVSEYVEGINWAYSRRDKRFGNIVGCIAKKFLPFGGFVSRIKNVIKFTVKKDQIVKI